jgi:hypothetical protein
LGLVEEDGELKDLGIVEVTCVDGVSGRGSRIYIEMMSLAEFMVLLALLYAALG